MFCRKYVYIIYCILICIFSLRSWFEREVRLVMEEREKKGLLYVEKNYIDFSMIELFFEEDIEVWDVKIKI